LAQNRQEPVSHLIDSVLPVIEAGRAELVRNTHECSEHVRLVPTPGHTIDHVGIALGRDRDAAVVTGDLIHSPLQLRHPQLAMQRDFDPLVATATRRRFLERYADTETLCCTAHFPTPSVGRIVHVPGRDVFEMVAA
jgi:glyoxylase-like metal-dependent hydrolase (beta-lactamase superfamily II)